MGAHVRGFPTFKMTPCHRHFFKGHRWWCRGCDRDTERQFREVCELWWRVPREISDELLAAGVRRDHGCRSAVRSMKEQV